MSDFGLASIHTVPGRCSHSPTLPSRLPRQQPDSDADRAMEYLSLKARQLPARALDHAQPCPSFSSPDTPRRHNRWLHHRCLILVDFYDCSLQI
jgi:hypothetical protein